MARIISVSACVLRIFPDSGGISAAERNDFRDIRPNMNLTEAVKLISGIPDEKQPFRRFRNGSAPAAENHKECPAAKRLAGKVRNDAARSIA